MGNFVSWSLGGILNFLAYQNGLQLDIKNVKTNKQFIEFKTINMMDGMNNGWGMGNGYGWIIGLILLVVVIWVAIKVVNKIKK